MEKQRTWKSLKEYEEFRFDPWEGIGKITINRPEVYNAFRPTTVFELSDASGKVVTIMPISGKKRILRISEIGSTTWTI